jgi:hypothetical protein
MNNKIDIHYWNNIKMDLQVKYPNLTDSDLLWREGTKDDLLKELATKLKISWKELAEIVDNL